MIGNEDDDIALPAGTWVLSRGVKRFVPYVVPNKWRDLGPCPACDAGHEEPCRRPSGQTAMVPHDTRRLTSRCACGRLKTKRAKRCRECHTEAKREQWRRACRTYRAKEAA